MSMTRRDWLTQVFGAAAAAAVAPLINLTDTTPAFWNQEPIKELLKWKIAFPDGTVYSFNASVLAEKILADGTVSLTLRPDVAIKVETPSEGPAVPEYDEDDEDADEMYQEEDEPYDMPVINAQGVTLHRDSMPVADIVELSMPGLDRHVVDVTGQFSPGPENYVLGVMRRGTITINYTKG